MDPTAAGAQPASRTKNIARQLTAGSDAVRGAVGNLAGEAEQAPMPGLIENLLRPLRLQSMLAKVSAAGFRTQVQSSLDKNNDSLPITRGQIRTALGDEHVQQIIKSLDISIDKVVELLAKYVPQTAAEAYSMSISSNSEGA